MYLIRAWVVPTQCGEVGGTGATDPTSPHSVCGYNSGGGGCRNRSRTRPPLPSSSLALTSEPITCRSTLLTLSKALSPLCNAQQPLLLLVSADAPRTHAEHHG